MTQAIAKSPLFGQTRLSREAIAEFQILTDLFDVTQGRSVGLQVQAISRSGTNSLAGSLYGFFQSDKLNAADHVAARVLPFSNQQVGASVGGPIVRDRIHYFATYEYERQPNTVVFQPPGYAHTFAVPTRRAKHSVMARGDYQMSNTQRLMVRYTSSRDSSPFWFDQVGGYPTAARRGEQDNLGLTGAWTSVLSDSVVQEVKAGSYSYFFTHSPTVPLESQTTNYQFPGMAWPYLGTADNIPEEFWQDSPSIRYDVTVNRGAHELKVGADYLHERG